MSRKSKPKNINSFGHYWFKCSMCGPVVICGNCGNRCHNCCREEFKACKFFNVITRYGILSDGNECDICPSAYKLQEKQRK